MCSPLARSIFKQVEISFTLGILGTLEHFRHSKGDCAVKPLWGQLKARSSGLDSLLLLWIKL